MALKKIIAPSWCKIVIIIILGLYLGKVTLNPIELSYGMSPTTGKFPPAKNLVLGFPAIIINMQALQASYSMAEKGCVAQNIEAKAKNLPLFPCEIGFGGVNINNAPVGYKIADFVALFLYWYLIAIII